MSPRMEADFNWADDVQASIPILDKGDYELKIKNLRGSAFFKRDKQGNPTDKVTKVIRLRPEAVGFIDSNGKLQSERDGFVVKGAQVSEINLWLHSEGGRRQAKKIMMAIAGFDPESNPAEEEFNQFLKDSKLNLGHAIEEREDGDGLVLTPGEGFEKLLVGKAVRSHLDKEMYEPEDREPEEQQNYVRFWPVNAA